MHQEYLNGLAGGLLIGLSSALLLLVRGKIAGISGIIGSLFDNQNINATHISFLLGLILAPFILANLHATPEIKVTHSHPLLIIAGLLVGVGTQLGSGCTSGHGVCGISRGSLRSITATITFMFVAAITVFLTRHIGG